MSLKKYGITVILAAVLLLTLLLTACSTNNEADPTAPDTSTLAGDTSKTGDMQNKNKAVPEFIKWWMDGTFSFDSVYISYSPDGKTETSSISTAVDGDKMMMLSEKTVDGELYKTHIIRKDGKTYFLDDAKKSIMELPTGMTEIIILESGDVEKTGEGMGEINGKSLPYVDYTNKGSHYMTRFYLEGDDVYGFENNEDGNKTVQIISNASGSVLSNVFDFPEDYTQVNPSDELPDFGISYN